MNQAFFAGRLGRDSELRHTGAGTAVLGFSIAVDMVRKGEKSTLWVDASIWGDRAEKLAQYMTKGTCVAVTGEVGIRTFDARDGGTKAALTCNVRELTMLGGKRDADAAPQHAEPRHTPRAPVVPVADSFADDDIPFVWMLAPLAGMLAYATHSAGPLLS